MLCPNCNIEMEVIDTTYSNTKTNRASIGEHTGDIYICHGCDNY